MDLYYEIHGDGPPLVLIPGFVSGIWTWFRQTEELARDFRVITFDPRGIGHSLTAEAATYSMTTFATDIVGILDECGIGRAHLLGASFGGFVAQAVALQFPERVDRLVLACTTAGGRNHVKPEPEILRSFAPDPTATVAERVRRFFRPAFSDHFNAAEAETVEEVCVMREQSAVGDALYAAQLEAAFSFDSSAMLGAIQAPTLVISGDEDRIVPAANSRNLAAGLPSARLEIVSGGSHLFFIEDAPRFNRCVREFLLESTDL